MSPRAAFLLILGNHWGPRVESLVRLSGDVRDFLANCGPPCGSSSIEGAREGCWNRFLGMLGAFPGGILGAFWSIFALLPSFIACPFCSKFVPSLSKFWISRCSAVGAWPWLPCPSVAGAVVALIV